ncbi:AAA family ATPase [Pseudomonas putida]|uniref:AAA family ATPase n=1 Tax=Pseudomonas putida TaxID=303 RepID=A0ABD7BN92_PSEPU|nr:AAA family ATPase [Pseudomonas putida]QOD00879.1 AAA family ATPase [Pseudomonas putida]
MITSFQNEGIVIPLNTMHGLGQGNQSLFAADTMTLLVGANGSGKTQTMMGLASALIRKSSKSASITWEHEENKNLTCAVYYTSAPYYLPGQKRSDQIRFIKTSLSNTDRPLTSERKEVINQIKSAFGLEARKILSLPKVSEFEIRHLFTQIGRLSRGQADPWLSSLIKKYNEINTRVEHPDGSLDWDSMKTSSKLQSEILSDFAKGLKSKVGPDFVLLMRAFAHTRSGRAHGTTAQIQILEAMGLTLNRKASKTATIPKKNFSEALDKLQKAAAIVGDNELLKNVYYIDDDQHDKLKSLDLGKLGSLSLTELSSGAAALIHQFSSIEMACASLLEEASYTNLILMIDEGDAFLHLAWQQRYVEYLDKTASMLKKKFKTVQVLIATHSPVLMSDFPRECTFILDGDSWFEDLIQENTPRKPTESFGAPLDAVVREVGQTGTMGTFAAKVIKQIVDDIANGVLVSRERVEMIGDPIIRRQIDKMLMGRGLAERRS